MAKTKKVTDQTALVTEGRMAVLLSRWAKAADAQFTVKLAALKVELREEILAELNTKANSTIIIPGR